MHENEFVTQNHQLGIWIYNFDTKIVRSFLPFLVKKRTNQQIIFGKKVMLYIYSNRLNAMHNHCACAYEHMMQWTSNEGVR